MIKFTAGFIKHGGHFQGCLPLVLMFDVKETIELDQSKKTATFIVI